MRNIQYTEKCSKCRHKITPQNLKQHEAVCDDQQEVTRLQQEMQEAEERRLLDMFKHPRLCEFQPDICSHYLVLFFRVADNSPIPCSTGRTFTDICSDVELSGLIAAVPHPESEERPFMGAHEDAQSTATSA